jgi:hypothetical protein
LGESKFWRLTLITTNFCNTPGNPSRHKKPFFRKWYKKWHKEGFVRVKFPVSQLTSPNMWSPLIVLISQMLSNWCSNIPKLKICGGHLINICENDTISDNHIFGVPFTWDIAASSSCPICIRYNTGF